MDITKSAFPDFQNEIEQIMAEDNCSLSKLKYTGTHKGKIWNKTNKYKNRILRSSGFYD